MKLDKLIRIFTFALIPIAFGLIFYSVFIYYTNFSDSYSSNISNWGQTGAYFGGIVGSLLSFITIILLIYSLTKQHEESLADRKAQITNSIYDIVFRLLKERMNYENSDIEKYLTRLEGILNSAPSSEESKKKFIDELYNYIAFIQDDRNIKSISTIILHAFQLLESYDIDDKIKDIIKAYLLDSLCENEKKLIAMLFLSKSIKPEHKIIIMNNFNISKYNYGILEEVARELKHSLKR